MDGELNEKISDCLSTLMWRVRFTGLLYSHCTVAHPRVGESTITLIRYEQGLIGLMFVLTVSQGG